MIPQKLPSASTAAKDWRELYLAALFEADPQKLPFRIAVAEKALLVRARELLATSEHSSEEGEAG
jgi:hypothetical protein